MLFKAIAKSNGNLFTVAIRATTIAISDNFRESNKEKKQSADTKNEALKN